jgi:ketosteroid isomerase-like protein
MPTPDVTCSHEFPETDTNDTPHPESPMRRLPILLGAMMLTTAAACRPQRAEAPQDLSPADIQAIQSVSDRFPQHLVARNADSLLRLYTADAFVMPPNHPAVTGRDAIRQWQASFPPVAEFTLNNEKIEGRGDLAYVRGYYVMRIAGAPVDTGKYLEIRRRQPDGSWPIAVDIFNSNSAAPTPASRRLRAAVRLLGS